MVLGHLGPRPGASGPCRCARATRRAGQPSARAPRRAAPAPPRPALSEVLPRPGPRPTAGRGGVAGPSAASPHPGPGASAAPARARHGGPERLGGRRGGSSARARRCLPLPRPALLRGPGRRGLSGGAAPRERQVRRHPTQGQRARGREPRRVCPPRAPGRACDLGGTTPCPQWPRTDPQRARREGPRHARLVPLADPGGRKASSLFTPPQPRTDGRPGDSDSHRWSLCGDAPPPARPD